MKTTIGKLAIAATLLFSAASAHAIPLSYGQTSHSQPHWQTLEDPTNGTSYGVSWSIDGGAFGNDTALTVGQSVQFRFNMHKRNVGTHYADLLGAWVDWGQDGKFNHAVDQIVYHEHILAPQQGVVNTAYESSLGSWEKPDTPDITVFSNTFLLGDEHVGDLWLRAVVTCTHSVTKKKGYGWNAQWSDQFKDNYQRYYKPRGYYYQGETEEWKISVAQVPEPGTLALLGLGIAGLIVVRKNAKAA